MDVVVWVGFCFCEDYFVVGEVLFCWCLWCLVVFCYYVGDDGIVWGVGWWGGWFDGWYGVQCVLCGDLFGCWDGVEQYDVVYVIGEWVGFVCVLWEVVVDFDFGWSGVGCDVFILGVGCGVFFCEFFVVLEQFYFFCCEVEGCCEMDLLFFCEDFVLWQVGCECLGVGFVDVMVEGDEFEFVVDCDYFEQSLYCVFV